jgi:hypothetical protein
VATIVYLDADDEITSAANRIRQADDARVALVIPFGSRVATSRINFKLLAREAMVNGRRLDIVAPDASARALAASAGLPVFGSVGEYEAALDAPAVVDETGGSLAAAAGLAAAATATGAATAAGAAGAAGVASGANAVGGIPVAPGPADPDLAAAREAELDAIVHRGREIPVAKPRRRGVRAGLVVGFLVLLIAFVAAGAAAYLVLPSAEISVTPQIEDVGPIDVTVRADPAATAVDEAAGVIPAQFVDVPVEVSGEFTATGKRTETTAATGGVRWKNCDPSASYTIPRGTVVRTASGVAFTIDESVFLPVAVISGTGTNLGLKCQTSEVAITAVKEGPAGNVDAGTIRVVPARYNRTLITVNNPKATTGGSREEFTRISKKDVDAALATLEEDLQAQFQVALEDPVGVPAGATLFPETAALAESAPSVDPESLVNQEVESFTLGLTAEGTVLAVDSSPVEAIAESALRDAVKPGYELIDGSTKVVVGDGTVDGTTVVFAAAGSAEQVRPVDGEALRQQVLGLPEAEARAILEPYGEVELVLWPGFVSSVPTLGQRVTLVVRDAVDPTPDIAPVPATPDPTEAPSGSPDGEVPSEPLPSG